MLFFLTLVFCLSLPAGNSFSSPPLFPAGRSLLAEWRSAVPEAKAALGRDVHPRAVWERHSRARVSCCRCFCCCFCCCLCCSAAGASSTTHQNTRGKKRDELDAVILPLLPGGSDSLVSRRSPSRLLDSSCSPCSRSVHQRSQSARASGGTEGCGGERGAVQREAEKEESRGCGSILHLPTAETERRLNTHTHARTLPRSLSPCLYSSSLLSLSLSRSPSSAAPQRQRAGWEGGRKDNGSS